MSLLLFSYPAMSIDLKEGVAAGAGAAAGPVDGSACTGQSDQKL
jgi:hypothetical protein